CEHGCVDGEGCADPCVEGSVICIDGGASTCVEGDYTDPEPCSDACVDEVGCVACVPGSTTCEDGNSMMCDDDGQGYELSELCDGVQGVFCNEDVGVCDGDCAPDNLQLDYLGCEYYATVTQQYDTGIQGTDFFTITVSNTADVETDVTIDGNGVNLNFTVAPNSVVRQKLPWVNALYKGTGPSKVVSDGAYRIRANHPVTVIQYSPIDADVTNDASLLLPVNAWTGSAMVASYPFWINQLNNNIRTPGFYAVTASQDNTTVQLSPSATGNVVQPGSGVAADGTGEVTLDRGDVLQVVTSLEAGDLTGTMISADKPVQLIAGHSCTEVPQGDLACDHLEESMPPIEALSDTYVVMPPVQTPNNDMFHGEVVRVIASEADTAVVFTPDIGEDITLENAGDFIDIPVGTQRYLVEADKKILVAQYMVGAQGGFGQSDPSMALAVATGQYRKDFLIHAPPTWQANYANLIAPLGAMVEVDGEVVPEINFTAIPETDYMTATVLMPEGLGLNQQSIEPIGLSCVITAALIACLYFARMLV
ncbi:MAG: IgGFc-binding protein, partial [Nannocystaceae bacterium]